MTIIGIVSEYYDPEGGSAAVPGFIARALVDRGLSVEVLTGFPNYPSGAIYPGYKQRTYQREVLDGVVVHRVPLYPSHNSNAVQRIGSYASFSITSAIGMHHLRHCDLILVYSTPMTVGLGAAIRHAFRRQPVVTMIQDLWPETMVHSGFPQQGIIWRTAQRLALVLSNAIYRRSNAIAVISPGMINALVARGLPKHKIHLIHNWVPDEIFRKDHISIATEDLRKSSESLLAIYAGNLGEPQSVRTIVDAASILRDRDDIEFVIVGSGVLEKELRQRVADEGLTQVRFLGTRPINEVPALVGQADIQLVSLAPSPIFEMTIPSKLQFSLGFGKAIIAAVSGDPATIAKESGAAFVCSPGSGLKLAEAISHAASRPRAEIELMGQSGKEYFNEHFSEKVGGDSLAKLLRDIISKASAKKR